MKMINITKYKCSVPVGNVYRMFPSSYQTPGAHWNTYPPGS